jgi:hypothetical protein
LVIMPDPQAAGKVGTADDYFEAARAAGGQCLAAALYYRARGWSALAVCPPDHVGVGKTHAHQCKSPGKAPWGPWKGFQTRLPTEAELRQKWRDNPVLNVGVALGGITGFIGLDVDQAGGEELLRRLAGGDLPDTLEFTSGEGRRLLYRTPAGVELRPTPQPGGLAVGSGELRLLGLGTQTVMPPSRHVGGRRYAWVPRRGPGEVAPAVAPSWVVAHMRRDGHGDGHVGKGQRQGGRAAPVGDRIPEKHRNTTLTSLAGSMRYRGMSHDAILAALLVTNEQSCDPPLDDSEVETIARSVGAYPAGPIMQPGAFRRHAHAPHSTISFTMEVE